MRGIEEAGFRYALEACHPLLTAQAEHLEQCLASLCAPAARVLVGLSREEVAERAGLCRHSIRKWEISSHAMPGAMYLHLIRVVDMLEGQGARFSGDGVSALSGDSPDYLMEAVPPSINSNDSKGLHLAARARHAGVSYARHEQELQS